MDKKRAVAPVKKRHCSQEEEEEDFSFIYYYLFIYCIGYMFGISLNF